MRKLFFAACAFVMAAFVVSCTESNEPTLVGEWQSDKVEQNGEGVSGWMTYKMTLNADSTMSMGIDALQNIKEEKADITMPFQLSYDGKWADLKEKLVWCPDTATTKISLVQDSIKIKMGDPSMDAFADKMVKSLVENFDKEMGAQIKNETAAEPDTNVYVLKGDELSVFTKTDTIVFHRQKPAAK